VTEEEYIGIVGEIFDGYTDITFQGKTVYIKHFSIRDQRYIHRFYNKYKSIASLTPTGLVGYVFNCLIFSAATESTV